MEILNKQLGLFLKFQLETSFESIANSISSNIAITGREIFPIPSSAPAEIPRLVIRLANSARVQISKNRVDIFFTEENIDNIIDAVLPVILVGGQLIDRVGYVQRSLKEADMSALRQILNANLQTLNPKELNLRVNILKTISDYECNSIESLSLASGTKTNPDGSSSEVTGILVERDINTLNENRAHLSFDANGLKAVVPLLQAEANTGVLIEYDDTD